jgi:hypothetical protein
MLIFVSSFLQTIQNSGKTKKKHKNNCPISAYFETKSKVFENGHILKWKA